MEENAKSMQEMEKLWADRLAEAEEENKVGQVEITYLICFTGLLIPLL